MPTDAKTGWTAAAAAFVMRIHPDLQVLDRLWCETKLKLGLNNFFLSDMTKNYDDRPGQIKPSVLPFYLVINLLSRSFVMSQVHYSLEDLFAQLGLKNDSASIESFISQHHPLPNEVALYRASIWNPTQRAFLKEEIIGDGAWALAIDELNRRLH